MAHRTEHGITFFEPRTISEAWRELDLDDDSWDDHDLSCTGFVTDDPQACDCGAHQSSVAIKDGVHLCSCGEPNHN